MQKADLRQNLLEQANQEKDMNKQTEELIHNLQVQVNNMKRIVGICIAVISLGCIVGFTSNQGPTDSLSARELRIVDASGKVRALIGIGHRERAYFMIGKNLLGGVDPEVTLTQTSNGGAFYLSSSFPRQDRDVDTSGVKLEFGDNGQSWLQLGHGVTLGTGGARSGDKYGFAYLTYSGTDPETGSYIFPKAELKANRFGGSLEFSSNPHQRPKPLTLKLESTPKGGLIQLFDQFGNLKD